MSDPQSLVEAVDGVLAQLHWPAVDGPMSRFLTVEHCESQADQLVVQLRSGIAIGLIERGLKAEIEAEILKQGIAPRVRVFIDVDIAASPVAESAKPLRGVKNVIAVASGKGGVGKSTTSVNLALALAAEGAKVGLLDADIYGPSQQLMLGIAEGTRPESYGTQALRPIQAHGLQTMSMGFLVTEKTPMVWRGPMASGALQQLLYQTHWEELDYLIVDMPPGTGDIQLTLAQQVPVAGAVIVTTPQDIALLDAKKGVEMFQKVNVPVLGVIENMAMHICSNCQHQEPIFGSGGADSLAESYGVAKLGALPLDISIREGADSGRPTMIAEPDGAIAQAYASAARAMVIELAERLAGESQAFPEISVSDD